MAVNKVVVGNTTKLDLTSDTVTPAKMRAGVTAHNSSGDAIEGILSDNVNPFLQSLTVRDIVFTLTVEQYETLIGLLE